MLTLVTAYKFMLRRTWNDLCCMLWPVSLSAQGMASICFIASTFCTKLPKVWSTAPAYSEATHRPYSGMDLVVKRIDAHVYEKVPITPASTLDIFSKSG